MYPLMLCSCMTNATTSLKRFCERSVVHARIPISWWLKLPGDDNDTPQVCSRHWSSWLKWSKSNRKWRHNILCSEGYRALDAGDDDELNLIFCAFGSSTDGAMWTMMVIWCVRSAIYHFDGRRSRANFTINFTFLVAVASEFKYLGSMLPPLLLCCERNASNETRVQTHIGIERG